MDNEAKLKYLKEHIGVFPNFPKEGINFKDIFTAFSDGPCCVYLKDLLLDHVKEHFPEIDAVVGLESRGFFFSFVIAAELSIANVAVRKKGKLPGECYHQEYQLEYGKDVFEIQKASIKPGQKVLIVDDLLATGGSLESAIKLIRKAGGVVQGALVVMELASLNGRKRVDCDVHSLVQYEN